MRFLLCFILFAISAPVAAQSIRVDFRDGLSEWQEKSFSGRVNYQIVTEDGHQILHAESGGKASALIHRLDINPQQYPTIRWRWKIDKILEKGYAGNKAGDDYPARIYIVFDSWLPNYARSINYIWASHVERETMVASPYYRRSIMLAVNTGDKEAGRWVIEERNLLADYQRAFGDKIPMIKAVAVMSDGDNTGESATAWYDWIEFVPAKKEL